MLNPINFLSKFIKSSNQRVLDKVIKIVEKINILEDSMKVLKDIDFPQKTNEFILGTQIQKGINLLNV